MTDRPENAPLNVVAVSGSLHEPSKTTVLLRSIVEEFGARTPINPHLIELSVLGREISGALSRDELSAAAEQEVRRIEQADLLVVASPVYRASFTGLFKHLFDFVDQYALVDTPVLVSATGGGERHALILEHSFRPLFGFFQALTLPIGVYASTSDFTGYELVSPRVHERISLAVDRALPLVVRSQPVGSEVSEYVGAW
ncbi:FMN reductase [Mycetocola reblochoni]|uniref:FMN reductase n=2 Tax=Mycetocola reblochoni TaxID=331618 RepID=A0A1R4JGM0_9MICO|nr:FMN reductase [Mycetocola reblochoni]RLP68249.1 FMN reductase [Mycetocola reblochoni]SJN31230.1 FMN reductase [Mycetocola reblochoni REB411]